MLDQKNLEQRLVKLEQTVSELQQKVESQPSSKEGLEQLIGSISDEVAFLEALEYGRFFRQQDQPKEEES
ncbi:transferase hexapeptide repeat containing protein [Euhalothece natronophila Z-M001]|uniref:Transferase hexapeptide repeat containing protein n=1 Tax=Euhalothece natronophila Z-M001 TaxID=522448 RepID=A0A5B8NSP8_9CHRO|nr:transferase hexapeptide repeat containing protein [Euhalothece natronophila]QDZ41531.1 transferase hexapeptide repeat containing protein [Euhalothece natronophila Z-M001]